MRPASPLFLRLGSSSRALGGSRSLKQIGRCHRQIRMPLKPLFILVLQKVKNKNPAPFAKSTRAPQVVLTTSYPSEPGILRTSVSKCDEKRIVRFLPSFLSRGPSGFPASSFLIPLLPGTPVNSNPHPAVQVRQHREQFLQPSRMARD